jgi:DNA-binding HxlR family transcriptional regulator
VRTDETDWDGLWGVLGCKWTFHVLRLLAEEDAQFNQIERAIEGLPSSTLSTRLKALRREGVVDRAVDETATPPTVTYSLTEKGEELADIVAEIEALEARYA